MTPSNRINSVRRDLSSLRDELSEALKEVRDRRRAEIVRALHVVQNMLDPHAGYASQAGQDRVIDRLFRGKTQGVFVDVGAYDGLNGSNSLFFETRRNWTGVLVEPVSEHLQKASDFRRSTCLSYAVADAPGDATFLSVTKGYTQMSGLLDQYEPELLKRVRDDPRHMEEEITVEKRTLSQILDQAKISSPDYVSLDIEGAELSVLRAFPFERYGIKSWSIENNSKSSEIRDVMTSAGYELIEFCGPDEIYALKELI